MFSRVYAEVTHVKNEFICATYDGAEPKFGFNRNFQDTANFIKQFYKEARVPPQAVEYVEAYGTGELMNIHVIPAYIVKLSVIYVSRHIK